MAYTKTPKLAFQTSPSKVGTFQLSEIEIDFTDWTSVKRCLDIKFYLDFIKSISEDHTTFDSTRHYLDWVFSKKLPFAQKLMVTLLVRQPAKYKDGKSHTYEILHDVFDDFTTKLESALETGKFTKHIENYKFAHFRRNELMWKRAIKELKEKKEIKSNNTPQQAIVSTFSLHDKYELLSDYWKKTLGIYKMMFFKELKGQAPFVYKDEYFRRYHPIQQLKREAQEILFHNTPYIHDYDTKTASLAFLISLNERELGIDVEATYPTLFDYMENKNKYRKEIAEFFKVDEKKGKKIFAHLINKGIISKSSYCSWKKLIEDDMGCRKTRAARKHVWLMAFYEEVKLMWSHCMKSAAKMFNEGRIDFKVNNKNRFDLYFFLERQVMDVCTDYLDEEGINYFIIHDGFRTDRKISPQELESVIYHKLKLVIEMEEN